MHVTRMQSADGDVVEQAEAHRPGAFGMMAGRAHRAKCVRELTRCHPIDGSDHGAGCPQCGLCRSGGHGGIGIDLNKPTLRCNRRDFVENQFNYGVVVRQREVPAVC